MQSSDLRTHGFGNWTKLNPALASLLLASLSAEPGVFAVRGRKTIGRAKGSSDLVFIGVGANRLGGIKKRIEQIFRPGPSQLTNQRLLNAITANNDYEISVVKCKSVRAANVLEERLLDQYSRDHSELPPFRRRK